MASRNKDPRAKYWYNPEKKRIEDWMSFAYVLVGGFAYLLSESATVTFWAVFVAFIGMMFIGESGNGGE